MRCASATTGMASRAFRAFHAFDVLCAFCAVCVLGVCARSFGAVGDPARPPADKPVATLPAAPADEAAERAKFIGRWKGFTVEGKGENPDRGPVQLTITVTDKTMHGIQIKGDQTIDHGTGAYTLDLAASPRHLDAAKANERGRPQAFIGIYTLEGDTLKWCVTPQKTRPETFETKKGQFLVILKRDKSAP